MSLPQFIAGPYELRPCRLYDEMLCAVHGLQVIGGFHGPMQWPRAKVRGRPQLIVCDGLLAALSVELRDAVAFHWGVHVRTVANWRDALGFTHDVSPAVHAFRAGVMRTNRLRSPEVFELPGIQHLQQLDVQTRRGLGWSTAGKRRWTEIEIQQTLVADSRVVSKTLGRSLNSVRSAKYRAMRQSS